MERSRGYTKEARPLRKPVPLTKWEDGAIKWEQMRDLEDRMGTVTMGVRVEKRAVLIPHSILIDGQGA